ncbi:unnamed protein product [Brassica oleracea]
MIGDGNFLPITHVGSTDITSTSGQANQKCPETRKHP